MSPTLCEELSDQQKRSVEIANGRDMIAENPKQAQSVQRLFYLDFAEGNYDCFEALVTYGYTGK